MQSGVDAVFRAVLALDAAAAEKKWGGDLMPVPGVSHAAPVCARCKKPHLSVALPWSSGVCTTCGERGSAPPPTRILVPERKPPVVEEGPPPPAAPIVEVPIDELQPRAAEEESMPRGVYDRKKARQRAAAGAARPSVETSEPGASGGAPTPKRRGRPPGPRPPKVEVSAQEFHDSAGSQLVMEIRTSRRIPFAVAVRHRAAGTYYAKKGLIAICDSREDAAREMRERIDAALELGWKLLGRPLSAKLIEIPKPMMRAGRRRRKERRGKA